MNSMTLNTARAIDLPVVWSREDCDTLSIVSNFIAFLLHFMTADNHFCEK